MAVVIETINRADFLATMWRRGDITTLTLTEALYSLGLYCVHVEGRKKAVAYFNNVRLEL